MPDRPTPRALPDPDQLTLAWHDGASFHPIQTIGADDAVVVLSVREPPVCGEWSYDDVEIEDGRFVAARVDGAGRPVADAVPLEPIRDTMATPAAPAPVVVTMAALADVADIADVAAVTPHVEVASTTERPPVAEIAEDARVAEVALGRPTAEALRRAFEARPDDAAAAVAWATHLERRGDARDALAVLDAAEVAGAPRFPVLCARASALGALLRYAEAERALREAASLQPRAAEVQTLTGVLACRRARWRDAIAPLRAGVAGDPASVAARYWLGEALHQTGDARGALEAYEAALALDPLHWRALKGMGNVLDRLGRTREAAEQHRRAREAQGR